MKAGDRKTLWMQKFNIKAYTDQFGLVHGGVVVDRDVVVTIVETRDVPDMWCSTIHKGAGIRAVDDSGKQYFCNWNGFPSDSTSPYWRWSSTSSSGVSEEWNLASTSHSFGPYVTPDGEDAVKKYMGGVK